ncbi:hypothetical protein [Paenibacillus humicola]|uniref:hypothetical protein n=1 Tax=Paenibacillus humicola TaxID=3110540 RepID=UPI00237BCC49|nr:hypothetical protein [Paenibacillus humicola]
MAYKVLTDAQVEHFIERGWVKLEQAFAEEDALAAQDFVWRQLSLRNIRKDDPSTWTQPLVHIKENYASEEFNRCNTQRFQDAIEDLIGLDRWALKGFMVMWGWWPVNFAEGSDIPWDVPTTGWHYDGSHFHHRVNSREQGLLCIPLFSNIKPQGGGTLVAEGTHHIVANVLNEYPDGLPHKDAIRKSVEAHPWLAELTGAAPASGENRVEKFMNNAYRDPAGFELRVVETMGRPGDVMLCHPFLFHARSQNHLRIPRFMCNRTTPLKEPMNLNRANPADYSPLERSIRYSIDHYSKAGV